MAQARTYLFMGFDVVVVAVPHDSSHLADKHHFWSRVSSDFRFDQRQPVFLNRSTRRARPFVSGSYWSWLAHGRDSVIAIEARMASGSTFDPEFTALVDRNGVDVIHVNYCLNMPVARRIAVRSSRHLTATSTIILDTHDVQAERYQACEIKNPFTGRRDSALTLARDELTLSRDATALLHPTKHELEHFRRILPTKAHFLLRPTTRNEPSSIDRYRDDAICDFIYVGNGHRANVRSIEWFFEHVAPRLDMQRIRVRIAGGIADHFRIHNPGFFAAYPNAWLSEQDTVTDLYAASRFVMVPMTCGSGISIKLVEALAMGKFVITSPRAVAALDGIEGVDRAVTVAETAEDFANAMKAMASRESTVNEDGRTLYRSHLSNARYVTALSKIVTNVALS
jgi:glycosyltransferase involved in cell wall biosynthesis